MKEQQVLNFILDFPEAAAGWDHMVEHHPRDSRCSRGAQHAQHKVAESFPKLLRTLYPVKLLQAHCLLRINTEIAKQGQAQGAFDRHCERVITELLQEQGKPTQS